MKRIIFYISIILMFILFLSGCSKLQKMVGIKPSISAEGKLSPVDKWLSRATPVIDDKEKSLNPYVLKVIDSYPIDGSYPYRWQTKPPEYDIYNGVTQNLLYKEQIVAKAHPNGTRCSNCCGLTFEVFFRAMQMRNKDKGVDINDFNGMTFEDLFNFMLIWFVVGKGDNPQMAIEYYGLGKRIDNWEEAKAGDFCDISRNNSTGHSIIFINWIRDKDKKIIGMRYFSSNSSGVGYGREYFSDSGGKVLRDWVRLARAGSIENYQKFDRTKIPDRKAYAP